MLKAVLFDMDGVIVDPEPLLKKAYFKMFNEVRIDASKMLSRFFITYRKNFKTYE